MSFNTSRLIALTVAAVGALCSLGFVLAVGRHAPAVLLALFVGWDLSPFIALLWANLVSPRWPPHTGATLQGVTLMVTLVSLAIYANAVVLHPSTKTPTATFLLVPLASWVFMAIVAAVAKPKP